MRVARGRPDGVNCFGNTPQTFLASLAPLIAFPLVGAGLGMFSEGPRRALTDLALTLCALLTPAVVSYEFARLWGRSDTWCRFATAFNWCEWILPVLAALALLPVSVAVSAGVSQDVAGLVLMGFLGAYGLWLHWFLARTALNLSKLRAAILVAMVNTATVLVIMVPAALSSETG
jgi:hypothetical protein